MTDKINLHSLEKNDLTQIVSAFKNIGWNKPISIYKTYLLEQSTGKRSIIVAKEKGTFCGYVTIKYESDYPLFKQQNIPEISDLNVLPQYRKRGIGSKLIAACEAIAKERSYIDIGLGVGMTEDYGNAQRLYVHLGYIPDGRGLHYKNEPVPYGRNVVVDDDLVIYLIKSL